MNIDRSIDQSDLQAIWSSCVYKEKTENHERNRNKYLQNAHNLWRTFETKRGKLLLEQKHAVVFRFEERFSNCALSYSIFICVETCNKNALKSNEIAERWKEKETNKTKQSINDVN